MSVIHSHYRENHKSACMYIAHMDILKDNSKPSEFDFLGAKLIPCSIGAGTFKIQGSVKGRM